MLTTSIHLGGGDINTLTVFVLFWIIKLQIQVTVTRKKARTLLLTKKDWCGL